MFNNIKTKLFYKFDEYKFANKILVSLVSLQLENNRIKIFYTFKQKSIGNQYFYLDELSLQDIKFDKKDEIILYKVLGVYNYLLSYDSLVNIKEYLEDINNGL
ncbi:hypothetical protein ACFX5K_03235 [Rickettsiales bacterium LUAb2]